MCINSNIVYIMLISAISSLTIGILSNIFTILYVDDSNHDSYYANTMMWSVCIQFTQTITITMVPTSSTFTIDPKSTTATAIISITLIVSTTAVIPVTPVIITVPVNSQTVVTAPTSMVKQQPPFPLMFPIASNVQQFQVDLQLLQLHLFLIQLQLQQLLHVLLLSYQLLMWYELCFHINYNRVWYQSTSISTKVIWYTQYNNCNLWWFCTRNIIVA